MINARIVTMHKRLLEASGQKENLKTITDIFDEKTCENMRERFEKTTYKYLVYANTRLITGSDNVKYLPWAISEYLKHKRNSTIVVIEKETEKVLGCFYGFIG